MRRLGSWLFLSGTALAQGATSSDLSVSFSFIHTNDMPVRGFSGFLSAPKCFMTRPIKRSR
jgi:hypothetical protein